MTAYSGDPSAHMQAAVIFFGEGGCVCYAQCPPNYEPLGSDGRQFRRDGAKPDLWSPSALDSATSIRFESNLCGRGRGFCLVLDNFEKTIAPIMRRA
jgi:hypothetical protein